jgi:lipopolysaccharide export system ATP-binding protein
MSEGKVFKEGVPEELVNDADVRKHYLGTMYEFKRKVFTLEDEPINN